MMLHETTLGRETAAPVRSPQASAASCGSGSEHDGKPQKAHPRGALRAAMRGHRHLEVQATQEKGEI